MKRSGTNEDGSFLFQVDILVNADSNGAAVERLLHVLNGGGFADFRIRSGIQLGRVIEEALDEANKKTSAAPAPAAKSNADKANAEKARVAAAVAKAKDAVAKSKQPAVPAAKGQAAPVKFAGDGLEQRIQLYIKTNKLIRLNVNKGLGVKLSIPCRIISFDTAAQLLTVYHVDEKQVHTLKLFEIDDFME